jgi:dihydroflavonol-4-reductase
MKALVTGATGFIGGNLARELLKQGYQVRALVRPKSNRININDLDIDVAYGDLRDKPSLEKALDGCDVLFHVGAYYTFWAPDPQAIYESNVTGTKNILSAALEKGIKKVVYTSTEATIKISENGALGNEAELAYPDELPGHYKKSKCLAERAALTIFEQGLPLIIVNPTAPVGPYDVKPTPTGKMIINFLNGRMPAYVDTGLNIVDVEDVARGHILALEKGCVGERYVLGGCNLTFREILDILASITGIKAPGINIPLWLAMGAAQADEFLFAKVLRRHPHIPVSAVRAAHRVRYFDCSRAVKELGLPQTPVEDSFAKAARWFSQNGYVKDSACQTLATFMGGER